MEGSSRESLARWVNAHLGERPRGELGGFNRSSQHLVDGGVDGDDARAAAGGAALSRADPVAGSADGGVAQDRVLFWAAIAQGVRSEDAALEIGVSAAVWARWFRHAGGVNPLLPRFLPRFLPRGCRVATCPSPN